MDFLNSKPHRIAIVADWLIDFWWAELVISHLLELFPEADIYTSVCFMKHPMLEWRRVYTSWLQRIPFLNRRHKLAGLLRPWAFRSFDLAGYDMILCSSSAESKQVAMGKWNRWDIQNGESEGWKLSEADDKQYANERSERVFSPLGTFDIFGHKSMEEEGFEIPSEWKKVINKSTIVCYCHTPTRYYWSHAKEYEEMMEFGWLNPLVKAIFRLVKWWMQRVDYDAAQKVDYFIANSRTTQERIQKYYERGSEVIYPGVETPILSFSAGESLSEESQEILAPQGWQKQDYYLGLWRCIPYKRFDLLVDAFNQNGKKLILCTATDTPLFRELKARSKSNIEWRFRNTNEEKFILMTNARAFLFPPEEDFGLVPVEAMMLGTPVIAYRKWWATESVIDWETGLFFSPQTPEALNETIDRFEKMHFDGTMICNHAEQFSKEKFQINIQQFIDKYA